MVRPRAQSLRLIIGGDENNTFEIREGETLTVGRDPGCTIQLNHHSVSPIHCRMDYKDNVLTVTDLDSQIGIYHHDKRKKRLILKEDTTFLLGQINIFISRGLSFSTLPVRTRIDLGLGKPKSEQVIVSGQLAERTLKVRVLRGLKRIPFFTFSLAIHVIIFVLVADMPYLTRTIFQARHFIAHLITPEEEYALEDEAVPLEKDFDQPDFLEEDLLEPSLDSLVEVEPFEKILEPLHSEIGIAGLSQGRYTTSGLGIEGTARLRGRSFSRGFTDYIEGLRLRGMDVVFVMDTTSSMLPFIDEARKIIDLLISKLGAVVPNLRMGMVAYRDHGDEYITRFMDLTEDRYEILNFLDDLQAVGGGDFPEAVYEGLMRTIESLLWRSDAKRVVILLGDAPHHKADTSRLDGLLRRFRRQENSGVVNTVYLGSAESPPSANEKDALASWKMIARVGGGTFSRISEEGRLIERLVEIAFHSQWRLDVARLLESVRQDRITRIIDRKARSGQIEWLLEGLNKVPVRAGIVNALIEHADLKTLRSLLANLRSSRAEKDTKWASLYILKKSLKNKFTFDPDADLERQENDLRIIEAHIAGLEASTKEKNDLPVKF